MRFWLVLIVVIWTALAAADDGNSKEPGKTAFDRIMVEFWQNKDYRFDHASDEIKSFKLDVAKYSDISFHSGTAFGARGAVIISAPLESVEKYITKREFVSTLRDSNPTIRELKVLDFSSSEGSMSAFVSLILKVPVIPDIPVKDRVKFKKFENYGILKWHQEDGASPLEWNRGMIILEPFRGTKTLASVFGVYVFRPEKALSLLMRPPSWSYALKHYSYYLRGLQQAADQGRL